MAERTMLGRVLFSQKPARGEGYILGPPGKSIWRREKPFGEQILWQVPELGPWEEGKELKPDASLPASSLSVVGLSIGQFILA
jgi:hypothetical protein